MNEITKIYKFSYRYGKIVIDEFDVLKETAKTYRVNSPTQWESVIKKSDIGVIQNCSFYPKMFLTEKDRKKFVGALKALYSENVQRKEAALKMARDEYQVVKGLN